VQGNDYIKEGRKERSHTIKEGTMEGRKETGDGGGRKKWGQREWVCV
jgi:hypothetical protein